MCSESCSQVLSSSLVCTFANDLSTRFRISSMISTQRICSVQSYCHYNCCYDCQFTFGHFDTCWRFQHLFKLTYRTMLSRCTFIWVAEKWESTSYEDFVKTLNIVGYTASIAVKLSVYLILVQELERHFHKKITDQKSHVFTGIIDDGYNMCKHYDVHTSWWCKINSRDVINHMMFIHITLFTKTTMNRFTTANIL